MIRSRIEHESDPINISSIKRARADEESANVTNVTNSEHASSGSLNLTHSNFFIYPFVLPLVVPFLTDRNVLTRLLLTCKAVQHYLPTYALKRWIQPNLAKKLLNPSRIVHVCVTKLYGVQNHDLTIYPDLRALQYALRFKGPYNVPDCVTHLHLPKLVDDSESKEMLLSRLEHLVIDEWISNGECIQPSIVSPSIMRMFIGSHKTSIPVNAFPPSLVELQIGMDELKKATSSGKLPETLEHIELQESRLHDVLQRGKLPSRVKHLLLPGQIDVEDGAIPDSVTDLTFGCDSSISGRLPSSLTHLRADIPDVLHLIQPHNYPASLTHLVLNGAYIPYRWEEPFEPGFLPPTLTHLVLSFRALPGAIPASVTHLRLIGVFPSRCELLPGVIPSSVIELGFGKDFRQSLVPGVIPGSVRKLALGGYNQPLAVGAIPNGVETLTFGERIYQPLVVGVIPNTVKQLKFLHNIYRSFQISHCVCSAEVASPPCSHQQCSSHVIPSSVTDLQCFWPAYVSIRVGEIPNSVTKLTSGLPSTATYHAPMPWDEKHEQIPLPPTSQKIPPGAIPTSVTELDFGYHFNAPIDDGVIPHSVKKLRLGPLFKQKLPDDWADSCDLYMSDEDLQQTIVFRGLERMRDPANAHRCFCENVKSHDTYDRPGTTRHHQDEEDSDFDCSSESDCDSDSSQSYYDSEDSSQRYYDSQDSNTE